MSGYRTGNQLQLFQQAKLATPVLDDLPGPDHLVEIVHKKRTHALTLKVKAIHQHFGF